MQIIFKVLNLFLSVLAQKKLLNWIPDDLFLKIKFRLKIGRRLNLDNPTTFNEKMQWLKLYDRRNNYSLMVDKYEVKNYVANIIGQQYIIPTLGVWDNFENIDFDSLPNSFVLKCTHDSGGLVICNDKSVFDIQEAKKKIEKSLKVNYYYIGREWPYKNIKPRIIAEENLINEETDQLKDYKFFCFNGKVKFFKIDFNRFTDHRANYYDREMNLLPFGELDYLPDPDHIENKPSKLCKMIELAEILSKGFPFLRVDLYNPGEKVYFGELTFYPASGLGKFIPNEWDEKLGELLSINKSEL